MVSPASFNGRRGILYYSQFKPNAPYGIADGIFVVPSGWQMHLMGSGAHTRMCRSHFVVPTDWSDAVAWRSFRDWIVFDSFVMMNSHATIHFDENLPVMQDVTYSVHKGAIGDEGDLYKALDYDDVTSLLVDEQQKPAELPSLSYAGLYDKFRGLPDETRASIEWFVSSPPSPRRVDAFFGSYWGLLHITILIEKLIGLPPDCEHRPKQCESCGTVPPPHRKVSRRVWLRDELTRRISDSCRVDEYASLIEAAKGIRDRMSHGPEFDRSSHPIMAHGQTASYDVSRAVKEFKRDSHALLALLIGLRTIAHALLVDRAFGIKYFAPHTDLKVTMIGQPQT
jgi:hypothetical protein